VSSRWRSFNGSKCFAAKLSRYRFDGHSVGNDYDYKYLKHHNFGTKEPPRDRMMSEGARSRLLSEDARSRLHSEESMTRESSGKTGTQSKLGLSHMGESIFSDDASFEEQYIESEQQVPFEITVPAGKLGVVIDTPNGGFPIVHAIKDTSILADRVRVGDRLVSVDGQDCTAMVRNLGSTALHHWKFSQLRLRDSFSFFPTSVRCPSFKVD
jgi:hypothetical protein